MATITYFISWENLFKLTGLNSDIDQDKISPWMLSAQTNDIQAMLGQPLFDKMMSTFDPNLPNKGLDGLYLEMYDKFVVFAMAYYTAREYTYMSSFQITNGGFFKNNMENTTQVDSYETDRTIKKYNDLATNIVLKWSDWIKTHPVPEYPSSDNNEDIPNGTNIYF